MTTTTNTNEITAGLMTVVESARSTIPRAPTLRQTLAEAKFHKMSVSREGRLFKIGGKFGMFTAEGLKAIVWG